MSDRFLDFGAMALELGIPALFAISMFRFPRHRGLFMGGVVGAAPFLALYAWAWIASRNHDEGASWGFGAMWVMTFVPFVVAVAIGAFVGALIGARKASPGS